MYMILCAVGAALVIGGLVFQAVMRRRRRNERRERSVRNRARQFGWEMVFGPRKLRLTHERPETDPE